LFYPLHLITLKFNVTLSFISCFIINFNCNEIDDFSESQRPKIALEKMFIPPTENEMKACLKNCDDDTDNIEKNNSYDDTNLKYSNVISSENAKFQKSNNESKHFNHYRHEINTKKVEMSIFKCKKKENQTSFCNNIENGETKVSVEENGNITKFYFWNFRPIFHSERFSFPVQNETKESFGSKILHLLCQYNFILYFVNFLDYRVLLHFVLLIFYFLFFISLSIYVFYQCSGFR
jgi:hypothetical protein